MPTIIVDGEEESVLEDDEQTMRPKDVAVQQQRVFAWHPILDPEWAIYSFLILAVIMIPVGTLNCAMRARKQLVQYDRIMRLMVECLSVTIFQVSGWDHFRIV